MRTWIVWLGVTIAAGPWLIPGACWASTAYFVEVTQPVMIEGTLVLGTFGYVRIESPDPFLEMLMTAEPNCTPIAEELPRNTNVAAAKGLVLRVTPKHSRSITNGTAYLDLDASAVQIGLGLNEAARQAVIEATIEAVRLNAGRAAARWPGLKRVQLAVVDGQKRRMVSLNIHPAARPKEYY